MSAVDLNNQAIAEQPLPDRGINKWEVLRELTAARMAFGISDREITVLQALLSFYPETELGQGDLIVFPSNAAICERLNGMPCSTMRRHLAGLVQSGLILRRDSPNGKRFVKRGRGDGDAFGFDLRPLAIRYHEICAAAEASRAAEERYERLRRSVSLMRRDLASLAAYGRETSPHQTIWDPFSDQAALTARALRRKLSYEQLEELSASMTEALDAARDLLDVGPAEESSTSDANNEHHHQNSNKDIHVLEPAMNRQGAGQGAHAPVDNSLADEVYDVDDRNLPNIPLGLVTSTCREFKTYVADPIRHWHQLVAAADLIRPMMGISPSAWEEACSSMGMEEAAVVVVAMLERFDEIKSPGGYLRALSRKAQSGQFSCGPMVMALMKREAA